MNAFVCLLLLVTTLLSAQEGMDSLPAPALDSVILDSALLDTLPLPKDDSLPSLQSPLKIRSLRDSSRFNPWLALAVLFADFEERSLFSEQLDSSYSALQHDAAQNADSVRVSRQGYQTVNLVLPVEMGFLFRVSDALSLGASGSWFHHRMSAILSDKSGRNREHFYALQAWIFHLDGRLQISDRLMHVTDAENFSLIWRWSWLLGATEVYNQRSNLENIFSPSGNGWSIGLGYDSEWFGPLRFGGDLGFSVMEARANSPWAKILPSIQRAGKARWGLGGVFLRFRFSLPLGKWYDESPQKALPKN